MRTALVRALAIAAAVVTVAIARHASANAAAAPLPVPAGATSPRLPEKTPLRVEREDLSFDCERDGDVVQCRFEARYAIANPTDVPQQVVAAFYGLAARDVIVRIGGAPRERTLTPEDDVALQRELDLFAADSPWRDTSHTLTRKGFDLALAAKERTEIVVTGTLVDEDAGVGRGSRYVTEALDARHPVLRTRNEGRDWQFVYLISPIRTWSGAPKIHVRLRYPTDLLRIGGPYAEGDPRFQERVEGDRTIVTGTFDFEAVPSTIRFGFFEPTPILRHGGPIAAIGTAGDDERRTRLRLGWEVGGPRWLLYSANVDLDFRGRVIVAPVVHAATPMLLILPSVGFGLGLPVQVRPETTVGVRVQLDAMISAVGFLASLDVFPDGKNGRDLVEGALMFKVSL